MEEHKTDIKIAIATFLISVYLFLEGSGITNISDGEQDAPGWILMLTGFVFMLTGIMILFRHKKNINNLLASLFAAVMGFIGGWVSLYGDEASLSGKGMLGYIFDMPFERVAFGFGSILSFLISAYAFNLFLKNRE